MFLRYLENDEQVSCPVIFLAGSSNRRHSNSLRKSVKCSVCLGCLPCFLETHLNQLEHIFVSVFAFPFNVDIFEIKLI